MKIYNSIKELNKDIREGKIKEKETICLNEYNPEDITETILGLTPLIYNLAIATIGMGLVTNSLAQSMGIPEKERIRKLRKRGIAVVQIIDKEVIETYQEIKGLDNTLKKFLKLNPQWKLTKENYFGIKTGKYILERVYRNYKKKWKEEEMEYEDE